MNQQQNSNQNQSARTSASDSAASLTAVAFPPIPLASGDSVQDSDGTEHPVAAIRLVITTEDGAQVEIPLDSRFGGWWAPANPASLLTLSA